MLASLMLVEQDAGLDVGFYGLDTHELLIGWAALRDHTFIKLQSNGSIH